MRQLRSRIYGPVATPSRAGPKLTPPRLTEDRVSTLSILFAASPILDSKVLEPGKILNVRSHKRQAIHVRDRRNLAIDKGTGTSDAFLSCSLDPVPSGFLLAIGKYRKGFQYHVVKKRLQLSLALAFRQAVQTVDELIPYDGCDSTMAAALAQSSHHVAIWLGRNDSRKRARVEQVSEIQSVTFLPRARSRSLSK